jgi:hypothetical protein
LKWRGGGGGEVSKMKEICSLSGVKVVNYGVLTINDNWQAWTELPHIEVVAEQVAAATSARSNPARRRGV